MQRSDLEARVSPRRSPCTRWAPLGVLVLLGVAPHVAGAVGASRAPAILAPAWPPPPEVERVRWIGQLRSARDLGRSESWYRRFARVLTGSRSNRDLALVRPSDVYAEDSTRVFVTDGSSNRLLAFDRPAGRVRVIGAAGPGRLTRPLGLGGDGRGHLVVTDPPARRAVVFTLDGEYVRSLGGHGILLNPVDAVVDPGSGRVYVVDSYLHQVVVFGPDGAVENRIGRTVESAAVRDSEFSAPPDDSASGVLHRGSHDARGNRGGGPGEFLYPVSITLTADSALYVTDGINARVQAFDLAGNFRFQFGQLGDAPGSFARPKGVAHDSEGHVYVVDAAFSNIQIFDARGRLMLALGELGRESGQFWLPLGLHVDGYDRIYVADRFNGRIQMFRYLRSDDARNR